MRNESKGKKKRNKRIERTQRKGRTLEEKKGTSKKDVG